MGVLSRLSVGSWEWQAMRTSFGCGVPAALFCREAKTVLLGLKTEQSLGPDEGGGGDTNPCPCCLSSPLSSVSGLGVSES